MHTECTKPQAGGSGERHVPVERTAWVIPGGRMTEDAGMVAKSGRRPGRRGVVSIVGVVAVGLIASTCSGAPPPPVERVVGGPSGHYIVPAGIHKIRHVVVIMQENRSFDSYFGTYPGADGIPMRDGAPSVCVPDPQTTTCVAPYVDHADVNGGGPHNATSAVSDIAGGAMSGFIASAEGGRKGCLD